MNCADSLAAGFGRLLTDSPRMKRTIIWIVSLCAVTSAAAQEISDTTWTGKGVAGLNLSQVSLSNWAAGGDGSVAFDVLLNYDLVYRRERHLWQNRLELAYGLNNTSSNGMRKTNDKIYLSSVYGYRIAGRGMPALC